MRLLVASPPFPPALGGVQTYAHELCQRFALSSRVDTLVVLADQMAGAARFDARQPYAVVRVPRLGDNQALSGLLPMAYLARSQRLDTVFCTHWSAAHAALWSRRSTGFPRRVFVAVHGKEIGLTPLGRYGALAQAAYDRIRRAGLEDVDGLFPVSHFTASLLLEAFTPSCPVVTVNNGVDAERFRPLDPSRLRARLGLDGCKVLLTVARLVPRKGIDTVIEALPQLRDRVPNLRYVVAGEGADRARLDQLCQRHGVGEQVRFLGSMGTDELVELHNLADVFVMPARVEGPDVEGFGLVFLEASACGRAVVGARAGGVVDAIREDVTGLLVPPADAAALADALARLLTDDALRARLGAGGRAHVLGEATWDHAAERLLAAMGGGTALEQRGAS